MGILCILGIPMLKMHYLSGNLINSYIKLSIFLYINYGNYQEKIQHKFHLTSFKEAS